MENSKNKSFSKLLTPEEQTKVLKDVIVKGLYDKVLPLAEDGYFFNIFIFDLLRANGKMDVLEQVWNTDFNFIGPFKPLLFFVVLCKGEEDAARFIADSRYNTNVWDSCYSYFTDNMLESVKDWDNLVYRGRVDILMRHERYDDIINNYIRLGHRSMIYHATQMLKEHNLMQRIIELKRYEWFLTDKECWPEGIQRLIEIGETQVVIDHFRYCKRPPQAVIEACSSEECRELLRHKGLYDWLYAAGYPEYMMFDEKWLKLASYGRFDLIGWDHVTDKLLQKKIVRLAVEYKDWDFLLRTKQYRTLLKQGKFKMVWKHIVENIGY